MNVSFCGHAQVAEQEKVEQWLFQVTEELIEQGADTFYLGGYLAQYSSQSIVRFTPFRASSAWM